MVGRPASSSRRTAARQPQKEPLRRVEQPVVLPGHGLHQHGEVPLPAPELPRAHAGRGHQVHREHVLNPF